MEEVPLRVVSPEEKRNAELPESCEITGDRGIKLADVKAGKATLDEFVAQLTEEELASIVRGEGMGSPPERQQHSAVLRSPFLKRAFRVAAAMMARPACVLTVE